MIIDAAPEPFKTLFAVAAETGMRSGELYGLRVEDVDFKRLLIFVRRSVWDGKEQSTKSEKADRVIDIQQQLADTILRHLRGRTDSWVFQSRAETPLCHSHVIQRVLHPLLKKQAFPGRGCTLSGTGESVIWWNATRRTKRFVPGSATGAAKWYDGIRTCGQRTGSEF